jgi:hypothetical protein
MKLQNIVSKSCINIPLYFGLLSSALAGEPQFANRAIPHEPEAIIQTWSAPGRVKPYDRRIRFPQDLPLDEYKRLVTAELAPLSQDVVQGSSDYQNLIGWLAERTMSSRGFFRDAQVNPLIAKFNALQDFCEYLGSKTFPKPFKAALKTRYDPDIKTASNVSVQEAYKCLESVRQKIDAIPEDCYFHPVQPGEKLETILPRYYPKFWSADPAKARNMLDSLASFPNPGFEKLGDHDVGYTVGRNVFDPMTKRRTAITVQENGKGRTYYYDVVPGSTVAFPRDQKLLALH